MSTAVLEKNEKKSITRYYIYGKGVVTRSHIKRDAWINRHALRYNDLLTIRNFTIMHGAAKLGLRIIKLRRMGKNTYAIKGLTADGQPFRGSYDFKTGTGTIDVG